MLKVVNTCPFTQLLPLNSSDYKLNLILSLLLLLCELGHTSRPRTNSFTFPRRQSIFSSGLQSEHSPVYPLTSILATKAPEISVKRRLLKHLFETYKRYERPTEGFPVPTQVNVSIKILAITSVDVLKMQYTADMMLLQSWNDPRLSWDYLEEYSQFTDNILLTAKRHELWLPDLFFRNGKEGFLYMMTVPNYMIRTSPAGKVLYSQKITMNLECEMDLQNFPMDQQECLVNIGSYGYTIDQLKFVWDSQKDFVFTDDMQISEFNTPKQTVTIDCTVPKTTSTGTYSCLEGKFQLKRQIGSYLVGTYIPAFLIVLVSWLTFWVNTDAIPARVTLGLLTLISLLTKGASLVNNLPRVSYIKAIDIWLIACLLFVIGALLEFTVASFFSRRMAKTRWKGEIRQSVRAMLAKVVCPCISPLSTQVVLRCTCCGVPLPPKNSDTSLKTRVQNSCKYSPVQPQDNACCCYKSCTFNQIPSNCSQVNRIDNNRLTSVYESESVVDARCCIGGGDDSLIRHRRAKSRLKTVSNCQVHENLLQANSHRSKRGVKVIEADYIPMSAIRPAKSKKQLSVSFTQGNHTTHENKAPHLPPTPPSALSFPFLLQQQKQQQQQDVVFPPGHCNAHSLPPRLSTVSRIPAEDAKDLMSEIDDYSRFLFPCFFILFNCAYWGFYLIIADPGFLT